MDTFTQSFIYGLPIGAAWGIIDLLVLDGKTIARPLCAWIGLEYPFK